MNFPYRAITQNHANFFQIVFLSVVSIFGLPAIAAAQIIITQSSSQTVTSANTVECTNQTTGVVNDNSFWRAFTLSDYRINSAFAVQSISFGIETANAAGTGTTQPVDVRIYANNGAAFPNGTLTQVGTTTIQVADQNNTVLNVPITASIPSGTVQLVLEIHVPDGTAAGHIFFVGSNTAAETGPSYISAATCGVTTPTTYAAIGFPNVHLVMSVTGLGTTAAGTQISGQVLSTTGKPVSGATVRLSDSSGNTRQIRTNSFGKFEFDDLNSGETYIIGVTNKQYRFNPQAVNLTQSLSNLTITAEP